MQYQPLESLSGAGRPLSSSSASEVLAERLTSLTQEGEVGFRTEPPQWGEVGTEVRPRRLLREQEWSWEGWGRRTEWVWVRLARSLEMVNFGAIGALLGAAIAGAPAFMLDFASYPFLVVQPLGAAVGALIGNGIIWIRWHFLQETLDTL